MNAKNKSGKIALFGVLALLVVLFTASTASAHVDVYFSSDPALIPEGECHNVTVQVLMNTTGDGVNSWGALIGFDSTCVNITDYEYKTITTGNTLWNHYGNYIEVSNFYQDASCPVHPNETALLNITVHCENASYCVSPLDFFESGAPGSHLYMTTCSDVDIPTTWHNGTVLQGTPPAEEPDLNVTSITVNPAGASGYAFANEWNNIKAEIIEGNGTTVTDTFYVRFNVTDPNGVETTVCEEQVNGITGGTTKDVWCNNSWVPIITDVHYINVTVDSGEDITEIDEGNNSLNVSQMVNYNGYKGKRYTGGNDITTWQFHDAANINLIYSTGDSKRQTGYSTPWTTYTANWTASNLSIPSGATIEKAALYVYYTFDRTPASNVTDYFTLDFNTCPGVSIDQHYTDRKGYGSWNYPYGMVRYNVTNCFNVSGNHVVLDNAEPTTPHHVSLSGMMLMVVYEHADEPVRKIWINEEYDILRARDSYSTNSTEATAYVPFNGAATFSPVGKATLVTVMADAFDGDDKNRLYFNGGEWHGIWNADAKQGGTDLAINETDVLTYLEPTDNEARLQSHIPAGEDRGDGMGAANAILILEKKSEVTVGIDCGTIYSDPACRTTLPITLYGIEDYGSGTINLFYDPAVVDVVSVTGGTNSVIDAWNKITNGHVAISAHNAQSVSGDIIFANVEFAPKGLPAQCSDLNLAVSTLYDTSYVPLPYETDNCTICIVESEPPFVTNPQADPVVILNDNGRARVPGTNVSTLSVHVTDDTGVSSVTVNLTPIRGSGHDAVAMTLVSGTNKNGDWSVSTNADHDPGVNLTHCLNVNATDVHGNSNTGVCITLTVLRRGDVVRDNLVDGGDALYIARYTVGLEPAPDEFVAGVVPADSYDGVNMADALYIVRYEVGQELAP